MRASLGRAGQRSHPWMCCIFAGLLLAACTTAPRLSSSQYPAVARGQVVDDYHGTLVSDPYRWLEALESTETQQFIARQNALAEPFLAQLPQRAAFLQRLTALYNYERFGVPVEAGGHYFYLRNDGQQDQAALRVADEPGVLGRVLIDPESLRGDATVSLADFVPSPDGKLLAYALSDAGSDWKTWRIREVDSGLDRPDVLLHAKFTTVSWARDSSGFYYSAYPDGDDQLQAVVRYHKLGDAQAADREIYAVRDHPTRVPYGAVTEDGRYLVISLDEGTTSNGILALPLFGDGKPLPVFTRYDGIYVYIGSRRGAAGTELLFRTNAGAPNGRIVAADMGLPAARWGEVRVPEAREVIESVALVGERLLGVYLQDASSRLRQYDAADGRSLGQIELPGLGSVGTLSGTSEDSEGFYSYADYATPTRIFRFDAATGTTTPLRQTRVDADLSGYVTEQVFFSSRDGTRVPMFIVRRRDAPRDGRGAVMLYGYGGFDISLTPAFSPATIAWLEAGGSYAVANLRGGGEYGAAWHLAGTRTNKQNVFDDFIAAAEYLVRERYAAKRRIVIRGGSNGGLLVGAVLTQRPELFGAALPDVGVHDMLRYHLASANARQWSDDFGLSEDAGDFRAQLAYSPVHNTAAHRCYPPTLVTTAARDNRVVPWHSFKFAASLQQAQRCDRPIILRVETRAGHGAGTPVWMTVEQYANQWAFAASALRMGGPVATTPGAAAPHPSAPSTAAR